MSRPGEIRAVKLQDEAGRGNGFVLGSHGVGNCIEVPLVRWVVLVGKEEGDHARRCCRKKRVLDERA